MTTWRFRALTSDVELVIGDPDVAALFGDLLAPYAETGAAPTLRYRVDRLAVDRGDHRVATASHPLEALAAFELDLYQQVVAACGQGVVLHAAALVVDGVAVVLSGPSGAGKTTLALRLLDRPGTGYVTEECALLAADGTVTGLPRPIARTAADDPATPPGFTRRPVERWVAGGQIVRRDLLVPSAPRITRDPVPVAAVVLIGRDAGRPTESRRLPGSEALTALPATALNSGSGALDAAIAVAGRVAVHRLVSRSPAEAIAAIDGLLSTAPHDP